MLSSEQILAIVVSTLPSSLHTFGLFLLVTTKFHDEDLTQRLYYIILSFAELSISLLRIALWIIRGEQGIDEYPVHMLIVFLGWTLVYETMIVLTIDRFLKVFLNIKYPLYWKYNHSVKLVICLFIINFLTGLAFWLSGTRLETIETYYYLPFDELFLFCAVGTYGYIFIMVKKKSKVNQVELSSNNQTRESANDTIRSTGSSRTNKPKSLLGKNKHFLSTFLLVITFLVFTVVPDLILFYFALRNGEGKTELINLTLAISYCTSFICDFVIYTFSSRPIRRRLKKWVRPN